MSSTLPYTETSVMSPLHIHLLLHYYALAEPPNQRYCNRDAEKDYTDSLVGCGLIEFDVASPAGYTTTERGMAYVRMICNTPLPVSKWIDPRTKEIVL